MTAETPPASPAWERMSGAELRALPGLALRCAAETVWHHLLNDPNLWQSIPGDKRVCPEDEELFRVEVRAIYDELHRRATRAGA